MLLKPISHAALRSLLTLSLTGLMLLLLSGPALAQSEEEDSSPPPVTEEEASEEEGRRPAIIRFDAPETEEQSTEDGQDASAEGDEAIPDEGAAEEGTTAPSTEEAEAGPPVIEPRRLVGEETEFPRHFEEEFDPFHPPPDVRVQLDFPDAELTELVTWMSALTGQNFIIADNVHAGKRITIIGPTPVTIDEAYAAFMAALHMNGLTVVPYGSFLRIVSEDDIQHQPLPFTPEGQAPRDDRMVTQIVPLDYIEAAAISELLNDMKTPTAQIQVYAPTNTLIITETGTNLQRLIELIDRLDSPGGETRFMYQVKYAEAEELASTLLEIFGQEEDTARREEPRRRTTGGNRRNNRDRDNETQSSGDESEQAEVRVSQIIADQRTNQLIIVASPRSYESIRNMAELLDQPIAGEGQIHVLFLENANATELAQTLQSLTQNITSQRTEEGGSRGRRGSSSSSRDDDNERATTSSSAGLTFTGDVSISADEPTNSLVVVASLRDYLNLQQVVEQLDRRREQVYVEAVIMEITSDSQGQYGLAINSGALPSFGGEEIPIFGGTVFGGGSLSSVILDPSALMGLAVGLQGPEISGSEGLLIPGIGLPSFGAILQALQTDQNVNVLSTPHILTTDNEEAEIVVGENIPFVTGGTGGGVSSLLGQASSFLDSGTGDDLSGSLGSLGALGGLGGLGLPTFQVQRESVSLRLTITPQINESNFVRLEIEEVVEDIIGIDPFRGPTTSSREARTVVVVEDQQTIVIGGLIQDQVTETVEKIPFLGDIPVIGQLFRNTNTRTVKRNLLLLLTPYIIRDSADFHEIFRRKMHERQEFLEFFGRDELDYVADIDYSRKNGPLHSIYTTIRAAVDAEEARRQAEGLYDGPQLSPTLESSPIGLDPSTVE